MYTPGREQLSDHLAFERAELPFAEYKHEAAMIELDDEFDVVDAKLVAPIRGEAAPLVVSTVNSLVVSPVNSLVVSPVVSLWSWILSKGWWVSEGVES